MHGVLLSHMERYPGVDLLDKVQSKAFRLISSSTLTDSLPSLSFRRDVVSLSLYYRYYFGRCSVELQSCIPPPLNRPRTTRQASQAHQYMQLLSAKVELNVSLNRSFLLPLSSAMIPFGGFSGDILPNQI